MSRPSAPQDPFSQAPAAPGVPLMMSPGEQRSWGAASHLVPGVAFVLSAGLLGFVASFVIYLMHRDRGPFVRQHVVNSLNAQLSFVLYFVVSLLLMLVLVGFVTMAFAYLLVVWIHVWGTVRAWNGELYRPPFTISFIKS